MSRPYQHPYPQSEPSLEPMVWQRVEWQQGDGRYVFEVGQGGLHATLASPHGAKLTLPMRLNQAGLPWTAAGFYIRAVVVAAAVIGAVYLVIGLALPVAVFLGAAGGFVALHGFVRYRCAQRMKKFLSEFPNAIDIVTRGVKTGLPIGDCLKAIASEGQEPVKDEFRRIVEDVSVGLTLAQALTRFTHRVPIMEANFFAVVIAIQSQLGGNLSEALGNLSRVLRERKMMKEKIRGDLKRYIAKQTQRRPLIMPVILEV